MVVVCLAMRGGGAAVEGHPNIEIPFERVAGGSDWASLLGSDRPLKIEIGVGKDTFLVEMAMRHPEFNYIGCEQSGKFLARFVRKAARTGVTNLRVVQCDAEPFLEKAFYPGQIHGIFVNFPDPWPKRRHTKKRFFRPRVARVIASRLAPGAHLSMRTDAADYARDTLELLDGTGGLRNASGPGRFAQGGDGDIPTLYELKYRSQGRPIYRLEYLREGREETP